MTKAIVKELAEQIVNHRETYQKIINQLSMTDIITIGMDGKSGKGDALEEVSLCGSGVTMRDIKAILDGMKN